MSVSPRSLKCEGCKAENELERVYCRACGVKLDRAKLPEDAGGGSKSGLVPGQASTRIPEAIGRRVLGMPPGVWTAIRVLASALVTGFLIQAFRSPVFLDAQKGQLAMQPVGNAVLQALEQPKPQTLAFSEADLNTYLGKIQRVKPGWVPGVQFGRFFVHFQRGIFCLQLRNDVWGWPLYMGLRYRVEGTGGNIQTKLVGASLGRVQLPAPIAPVLRPAFRNVFHVMDAEWRLVSKMESVRLEEGRLVMVTKGR